MLGIDPGMKDDPHSFTVRIPSGYHGIRCETLRHRPYSFIVSFPPGCHGICCETVLRQDGVSAVHGATGRRPRGPILPGPHLRLRLPNYVTLYPDTL